MIYVAIRRMAVMGQQFAPGDETDLKGLDHELLVIYLARQFFLPMGGLEALPDDLYLDVMEAID